MRGNLPDLDLSLAPLEPKDKREGKDHTAPGKGSWAQYEGAASHTQPPGLSLPLLNKDSQATSFAAQLAGWNGAPVSMRGKQTGRVVVNVEGTRTAAYDGVPAALGRTSPAPAPAQQRSSGQLMVPTDDAGPLVTGGNYSFPAAGVPDYEAAELERMLFKSGATLGRLAYDGINPQAAAAAAFAAGNRHRASDPNMGGRPYDNRAAATMRTLLPDDMAVGSDSWGRGGGGAAAASAAAMMAAHQTQQQQQAEDAAALMSVIMTAARVTNQKLPMLPANARGKKAAVPDPSVLAQFEPIIGHTIDPLTDGLRTGTAADPPMPGPVMGPSSHTVSRKSLLLKVPVISNSFSLHIPALVEDRQGHACLIILPSDRPSTRAEALAVEQLLMELLRDPAQAAHRAAAWRAHVLQAMCADAITAINESALGVRLGPRKLSQAWMMKAASGRPDSLTPALLGAQVGTGNIVSMLQGENSLQLVTAGTSNQSAAARATARGAGSSSPDPRMTGRKSGPGHTLAAASSSPRPGPSAAPSPVPDGTGALGGGGRTARQHAHSAGQSTSGVNVAPGARPKEEQEDSSSPQSHVANSLSMAIATSICMADVIRQVEVQCGERGRVLAYIWNAYLSTHEDSMEVLRRDNEARLEEVTSLTAQVTDLKEQVAYLEYLRKEIVRFRREAELCQEETGRQLAESLALKQLLDESGSAFRALESRLDKSLARLRWRHAVHVIGTRTRKMVLVSGNLGPKGDPQTLLRKVLMLETLNTAMLKAEQRKLAFGVRRKKADYDPGALFKDVVKSALHQQHQTSWTAGLSMQDPREVLQLLPGLQTEAQVLVMATMPDDARHQVMQMMSPEHRAQLVVVMNGEMREATRHAVGKGAWKETMAVVQADNELAARMLRVMDINEAVLEFSNWTTAKQMEVLTTMDASADWHTAAQLIRRLPINMRKDLLNRMDSPVAARILQVLDPPSHIIDALDGVAQLAQVRHLASMSPDRAAAALMSLQDDEEAAAKLVLVEDEEARNAILENIPPKRAAQLLLLMQELAAELASRRRQVERQLAEEQGEEAVLAYEASLAAPAEGSKEESGSGAAQAGGEEQAPAHLATEALLNMAAGSAENILGFLGFKEKASLMSSLPVDKVTEIMTLMAPSEAVAMLAAMTDASMSMVTDALSSEERERLVKALLAADDTLADKYKPGKGSKKGKAVGKTSMKQRSASSSSPQVSLDAVRAEELGDVYSEAVDRAVLDEDQDQHHTSRHQALAAGGHSMGSPVAKAILASQARRVTETGLLPSVSMSARHSSFGGTLQPLNSPLSKGGSTEGNAVRALSMSARSSNHTVGSTSRGASGSEVPLDLATLLESPRGPDVLPYGGDSAVPSPTGTGPSLKRGVSLTSRLALATGPQGEVLLEGGEMSPGGLSSARRLKGATNRGSKKGMGRMSLIGAGRSDAGVDGWEEGAEGGEGGEEEEDEFDDTLLLAELASPGSARGPGGRGARGGRGGTARGGRGVGVGRTSNSGTDKVAISLDAEKKMAKAARNALKNTPEGQAQLKAARERLASKAAGEDAWELALEEQGGPDGAAEPQGKLGKLPKNQRLKDAMAQHKNAKPKPKGWLLAVVDTVYKDAETMLRKLGRLEALRKQSVPEVVFAYFHNKYGQKNVVNEYVGSLVNTLTLYKDTDLRLEVFARFLSEEWDFSTFMDFLTAQRLMIEACKVVCIEYPKDSPKDEQYAWGCLYKCVYVADSVIGPRAKPVRDKFNEFIQQAAVQVEEAEVEKVRRDSRYQGEVIPDRFYKLPRVRFLMILCKELQRINTFISKMADDKFTRIDVQRTGQIPVTSLPGYLVQMLPPQTAEGVMEEVGREISRYISSMERDIPAADVVLDEVKSLGKDHFGAASVICPQIREHVKLTFLPVPRADDDVDEAELFKRYLGTIVHRHMHVIMPHLRTWLAADNNKDLLLQDLVMAVGREHVGDAKFKAYLNLLAGIVNIQVTSLIESALAGGEGSPEGFDLSGVEEGVCRLEDTTMMLLSKDVRYLLSVPSQDIVVARIRRLPIGLRVQHLGASCKVHRDFRVAMNQSASYVMQSIWRYRAARLKLANQREDELYRRQGLEPPVRNRPPPRLTPLAVPSPFPASATASPTGPSTAAALAAASALFSPSLATKSSTDVESSPWAALASDRSAAAPLQSPSPTRGLGVPLHGALRHEGAPAHPHPPHIMITTESQSPPLLSTRTSKDHPHHPVSSDRRMSQATGSPSPQGTRRSSMSSSPSPTSRTQPDRGALFVGAGVSGVQPQGGRRSSHQ